MKMTIEECYNKVGADYKDVMKRFGSEDMVQYFALKFLKDPSFPDLCRAMEQGDSELAFRSAHTLKGICLNLGFTPLYEVSTDLTEKLRGRNTNGLDEELARVRERYDFLVGTFRELC